MYDYEKIKNKLGKIDITSDQRSKLFQSFIYDTSIRPSEEDSLENQLRIVPKSEGYSLRMYRNDLFLTRDDILYPELITASEVGINFDINEGICLVTNLKTKEHKLFGDYEGAFRFCLDKEGFSLKYLIN